MSQHTKGPWHTDLDRPWSVHAKDQRPVALTATNFDVVENHANARLIAAAPELLEALKLSIHNLEFRIKRGSASVEELLAYTRACAAIAKAEGRA